MPKKAKRYDVVVNHVAAKIDVPAFTEEKEQMIPDELVAPDERVGKQVKAEMYHKY